MYPASKTAPHGRSFLRRAFAVNLAWGVILYLLIGENQEANLWIALGSFAAMMLLARAALHRDRQEGGEEVPPSLQERRPVAPGTPPSMSQANRLRGGEP